MAFARIHKLGSSKGGGGVGVEVQVGFGFGVGIGVGIGVGLGDLLAFRHVYFKVPPRNTTC